MRRIFFAGRKTIDINFEEEYTHNKSGSFVPIDEGMVPYYPHDVGRSHVYCVWIIAISIELLRPSQSRLKKAKVPDESGTAIERQKSIVERKGITLVNPDRFSHLAREWRVLR